MLDLNNKKGDKNEPIFLSYERAGVIADRKQKYLMVTVKEQNK